MIPFYHIFVFTSNSSTRLDSTSWLPPSFSNSAPQVTERKEVGLEG